MAEHEFKDEKDLHKLMDEFPSNSKKEKAKVPPKEGKKVKVDREEKKIEKVITGTVVEKKKPFGAKLKGVFIGGEFKAALGYIAAEVLLPAARNMVVDATTKGIERVIYGDDPRRRPSSGPARPRIQYNAPVDRYYPSARAFLPDQPARVTRKHDMNDLILASKEEAEIVVERMGDIIDSYQAASIADLKDLVGLPSTYVDNDWGWTSIAFVDIRQVRDGFLIHLPNIEEL